MRRKKSPAMIFAKGFAQSFLLIAFLLLVGFGSYKATMFYYSIEGAPENSKANELIKEIVSDATVDEISKNLILALDDSTGKISHVALEVLNTRTNNEDIITIPADTAVTLSTDLYQRLSASNSNIPQIVKLADLNQYFEEDYVADYASLIVADMIQSKISYYTSMNEDYFSGMFEQSGDKLVYTDAYKTAMAGRTTEETVKAAIKELYQNANSNLSIHNKEKYVPTYLKINPDYVYSYAYPGETSPEGFLPDTTAGPNMVSAILENETTYNTAQSADSLIPGQEAISSIGYKIQILNGSKINGLAASYQSKLTTAGYTVTGVGNYEGPIVTNTIVKVSTPGLGYDVAGYFKDATVSVESLEDGIDIQIILGTADALN